MFHMREVGGSGGPSPWSEQIREPSGPTYYYNAPAGDSQWAKPQNPASAGPSHASSPIEDESHALAVDVAKGLGVDIGDSSIEALTVPRPDEASADSFVYHSENLADAMQRLGLSSSARSSATPSGTGPPNGEGRPSPAHGPSPSAWTTPDLMNAPPRGGFVTMDDFAPASDASTAAAAAAAAAAASAPLPGATLGSSPPLPHGAAPPTSGGAAAPRQAPVPMQFMPYFPHGGSQRVLVPVSANASAPHSVGGGLAGAMAGPQAQPGSIVVVNGVPMVVPHFMSLPVAPDGAMPYAGFSAVPLLRPVPGMMGAAQGPTAPAAQGRTPSPPAAAPVNGAGGPGFASPAFTNAAAGPRSALATGGLHAGPQVLGPGPPIQTGDRMKGPDGANVFIFHIPSTLTNHDLFELFRPYGDVVSARIMVDPATGRSRGFGFVSYEAADHARAAIDSMNGYQLGRKRLKVQLKKERSEAHDPEYGAGPRGGGGGGAGGGGGGAGGGANVGSGGGGGGGGRGSGRRQGRGGGGHGAGAQAAPKGARPQSGPRAMGGTPLDREQAALLPVGTVGRDESA